MGIHDMLCPLLCMMQGFHAIAGINPLAQIHAQDLIVVQVKHTLPVISALSDAFKAGEPEKSKGRLVLLVVRALRIGKIHASGMLPS